MGKHMVLVRKEMTKMKTMMKILIALLFSGVVLLGSVNDIMASETPYIDIETLKDSEEYNDLLPLAQDIRVWMNTILQGENQEALPEDTAIDIGSAVKVYIGETIFSLETNETEVIEEALKQNCEYIWEYAHIYDGQTYISTISTAPTREQRKEFTGMSLEEEVQKGLYNAEDIQQFDERAGKWFVSSVGIAEYEFDYRRVIEEFLSVATVTNDVDKVYLVGGLAQVRQPVYLISVDGKMNYIIPTHLELSDFMVEGTEEQKAAVIAEQLTGSVAIYHYDKIAQAANKADIEFKQAMEEAGELLYGGGGIPLLDPDAYISYHGAPDQSNNYFVPIVIGVVLCLGAGVIGFILFQKKKHVVNV